MKQATITFSDNPEQTLERFAEEREMPMQPTVGVQEAGGEYPGERGYLRASSVLRIRPAKHSSGQKNVSISHDRYLASK
ncbi:hypothetical protein [Candidatus Thiosymbion oneisti]|uniref:hypothetical protein n=1 Tax=Candidatus Thiosymbion oneisti TaxID=589554 RepID=UPI00105EA884|nr:hypothetical protein [Candidatus Thiosymbion oneisti]